MRSSSPLLRITSHLANGGKHFEAKASKHRSVVSTKKDGYVDPDYIEEEYFEEPLVIHLSEREAHDFGIPQIDAISLARRVLEYWSQHVDAA
jgi:hypothetical protein